VETLPLLRRTLLGLLGAGLGLAVMAAAGRSDEVAAGTAASGIVIHGPDETLRDFCRQEDGGLWLELPSGARFELITSTSDPLITNSGDGSFHPFETSVVRAALGQVRFPLASVPVEVFLLPYPRRLGFPSAAGPGLVLLSPGVGALSAEQQHAQFVHELGHVVQYALMPDPDAGVWTRYRDLRGINDCERFRADAIHADRPHEIFAEDFRALFGGPLANYSGTIENATLLMPQAVEGLEAFVLGLAPANTVASHIEAWPNPSRGTLSLRRGGGLAEVLDLFDLSGRRVASLEPNVTPGGWSWSWDGRDARGHEVGPGVLFARVSGDREPALRIVRTK